MDEFSKYIYSLATLLKQHLKVKISLKREGRMHCLQEMWKKRLENPEYYRGKKAQK